MKEARTLHWLPPNKVATNESGFTSLLGGYKYQATDEFINLKSTKIIGIQKRIYTPRSIEK